MSMEMGRPTQMQMQMQIQIRIQMLMEMGMGMGMVSYQRMVHHCHSAAVALPLFRRQ